MRMPKRLQYFDLAVEVLFQLLVQAGELDGLDCYQGTSDLQWVLLASEVMLPPGMEWGMVRIFHVEIRSVECFLCEVHWGEARALIRCMGA